MFCIIFYLMAVKTNISCANLAKDSHEISQKVVQYINQMSDAVILFEQYGEEGKVADGALIVNKPFNFRVNYFAPYPLLIVGNKKRISVYDYEMQNISRIDAKDNSFNFLLIGRGKFHEQFDVVGSSELETSYLLRIKEKETDKISDLIIDKQSGSLQEMKIFENDSVIRVKILATIPLGKITEKQVKQFFTIHNPKIHGAPARIGLKQLEEVFNVEFK